MKFAFIIAIFILTGKELLAQNTSTVTEIWTPEPKIIKPGLNSSPPSDAIVLFAGNNANAWKQSNGDSCKWTISDGALTVKAGTGGISTRQAFGDCQLHIEWRTPAVVNGEGQNRGNSGVFMMSRYELQILDSYGNKTYVNGQAGSIYKQYIPLVNASLPPGEWQSFDIIFTAPRFRESGQAPEPARMTVFHNGVLVQNNATIWGGVTNTGLPVYQKHGPKEPLSLQDHGSPVSFRNIWIREL